MVQLQGKGSHVGLEVVFGLVQTLGTRAAKSGQRGGARIRADHLIKAPVHHSLWGPLRVLCGEA